jgi:hypothetical protein
MSFVERFILRLVAFWTVIRLIAGGIRGDYLDGAKGRLSELRAKIRELNDEATETNQLQLFSAVGRAITAWAKMEELLVIMVAHLLKVHPAKAGIVMYSIYNTNSWLAVIHDLFETEQNLAHSHNRFGKIGERIKKIKDRRDQVAHHSVEMKEKDAPYIRRSWADARSKSVNQGPLTIAEITLFTDTVLKISADLHSLLGELGAWRNKSPAPKIDPGHPSNGQ